jgi:hypothetical protein
MIKRNVHVEVDHLVDDGMGGTTTETVIFSIHPDESGAVPRLKGDLVYSVSCRWWVHNDSSSFSLSRAKIANNDGKYDAFVDYDHTDIRIKEILNGDIAGATLKASGKVKNVYFAGESDIEIDIKDKKELLKIGVQDQLFPASEVSSVNGAITNYYYGREDQPRPYGLGFVFSGEPVLLSRALDEYQISDEDAYLINVVYNNGLSVSFTDRGGGKFSLDASPGTDSKITFDATMGEIASGTDWPNFIDEVLEELFSKIGWTDYDSTNLSDLRTKIEYDDVSVYRPKVGFYIHPDKLINAADVIQWIMNSATAFSWIDANGDLLFKYLVKPEVQTSDGDVEELDVIGKINIFDDEAPNITTKFGATRNQYVHEEQQLAAAVTAQDHIDLSSDFQVHVESSQTLDDFYTDSGVIYDTLLPGINQVRDHADNIVDIYSVKRKFYTFECKKLFDIGDIVTLTHSRFNISSGKKLYCVGYSEDFINNTYTLILWG